jgi:hypothetical protein
MSAFAKATARQSSLFSTTRAKTGGKGITLPLVHPIMCPDCGFASTLSALEARGFEPLTSSLQSWRSTN